jgi:hypothetical protein
MKIQADFVHFTMNQSLRRQLQSAIEQSLSQSQITGTTLQLQMYFTR